MARIDIIKRFDNGPSQFLFDPAAFRHSRLDFYNLAIALARIVAAGIHDDHARWHAGEQPFRQCRNISLRNGDYDQIQTSRGILRLDRDTKSGKPRRLFAPQRGFKSLTLRELNVLITRRGFFPICWYAV